MEHSVVPVSSLVVCLCIRFYQQVAHQLRGEHKTFFKYSMYSFEVVALPVSPYWLLSPRAGALEMYHETQSRC